MMRTSLVVMLLLIGFTVNAQKKRKEFTRVFQMSLAPAVGTNGMHPIGYTNYFSLNLTSGISAANYALEIGLISNLNENETRGLQFAGISNVTGGNAYAGMQLKEIDKKFREGFEANLSGAQFSGITNIVLYNVFGWQATGGVNLAKGALMGFQLGGISNTVYKYSFGLQLAGLYNVSVQSMDGVQISGLFNITTGGLYGLQLALVNRAGFTEGIHSFDNDDPTGVQIGLVNRAKKMNGWQFGLVNISGPMQGTQIGLININNGERMPMTMNGTSIGLINISTSGHFSTYCSDVFPINIEIATGNLKNGRIMNASNIKYIQNSIIYSNAGWLSKNKNWSLGYGLKKYYFNRSVDPKLSQMNFIAVGVDFMHINHEAKKITKELSLLTRPTVRVGSRFNPKNKTYFFFLAASYNFYQSKSGKSFDRLIEGQKTSRFEHWPGFSVGLLVQ